MTHHPHQYKPGDRFEWQNEAYDVTGIEDGLLCFMFNGNECRVEPTKVAWLPQLEVYESEKRRLRKIGLRKPPSYSGEVQRQGTITRQSVTGRRGNYNHLR